MLLGCGCCWSVVVVGIVNVVIWLWRGVCGKVIVTLILLCDKVFGLLWWLFVLRL